MRRLNCNNGVKYNKTTSNVLKTVFFFIYFHKISSKLRKINFKSQPIGLKNAKETSKAAIALLRKYLQSNPKKVCSNLPEKLLKNLNFHFLFVLAMWAKSQIFCRGIEVSQKKVIKVEKWPKFDLLKKSVLFSVKTSMIYFWITQSLRTGRTYIAQNVVKCLHKMLLSNNGQNALYTGMHYSKNALYAKKLIWTNIVAL